MAQDASDDFNNEQLFTEGLKAYSSNNYRKAAIYLYAFIQRKPDAFKSSVSFSQQVKNAFKYSLERTVTGKPAGTKSDGEDNCRCAAIAADNKYRPTLQPAFNSPNKVISPFGYWSGNDGITYYFKQIGNEVWAQAQRSDSTIALFTMLHGSISGDKIYAKWTDIGSGNGGRSGDIILQILGQNKLRAISSPGHFSATEWSKSSF